MASTIKVQNITGPGTGANANKIIIPAGQTLDVSSGTLIPSSGQILKSETFQLSAAENNLSVSANADVVWWSRNFTTVGSNSRILITYHSGQINCTAGDTAMNARMSWSLNSNGTWGTNMDIIRDHNHEWYNATTTSTDVRFWIAGQALTSAVSAGTHTIYCWVGAYNRPLTFGHQGESNPPHRRAIMTFQEVAV